MAKISDLQKENEALKRRIADLEARLAASALPAQKLDEQKLLANQRTFKLFIEYAPAAIAMFDREMRYLAASRRYLSDYQLSQQDLTGRSHYDVFPGLPERWKEIHRRCLAGAVESADADPFPRADGSLDWVRWEIRPWYEGDGTIGGIILSSEVITASRRNEALLTESQRIGQIGHMEWSAKGSKQIWSDEIYAILGLPRESVISQHTIAEMMLPEEREHLRTIDEATFAQRGDLDYEFRIFRADGQERWLHQSMKVTYAENGAPVRMLAIFQDVTRRKQAELALQEREQKLTRLLEILPVGVSILDDNRQVVFDNPALSQILQMTEDGLVRGEYRKWKYLSADGATLALEDMASTRAKTSGQAVHGLETGVVKEDGETIWTSVSAVPVDFSDWKTVLVTVDITARKRVEAELRESQANFATIFENSPIALGISRLQDGKITQVNSAFTRLYGFTRAEAIGRATAELDIWAIPADRKHFGEQLRSTGQARNFETVARLKSGEQRHVLVSGQVVNIAGEPSLLAQIVDITERRQAQEQLQNMTNLLVDGQSIAHLGSFEYDAATKQTVWSKEEFRIYGYHPAQPSPDYEVMLAKSIHPEDAALLDQTFLAAIQGGSVYELEHRIVRPDGSIRWVLDRANPYFDQAGQLTRYIGVTLDITERKRAEDALRESEARYRLIAENTADVIWVMDPLAQKFTYVSPSVEKLRGYTPEEVLAQPISEALTPESLAMISTSLAATLPPFMARGSGTESYINEVDQPCKDGSIVKTEVTTAYLFNAHGQVEIVGVSRDITARKQAEESLRRRSEELEQLLDMLPEAIWIADDPTCQVIRGNHFANELLGVSIGANISQSAEAPAVSLRQFSHGRELSPDELPMQTAARTGQPQIDFELQIDRPDQATHYLIGGAVPLFDAAGQPRGVVAAFHEITERKRAEQELMHQAELLREQSELLEHAHVLARDMQNRIVTWNLGMERLYGWTKAEAIGQVSHTFFQTQFPEGLEAYQDELTKNEYWEGELTHTRKDGAKIVVSSHNTLHRNHQGKPYLILEVNNDITARKQMEEDLRRSNAELEQFAYVASHDLQEPLRTVAGMVQLLQLRYQGQLDARADEYIHYAVDASDRMQNLINDLLNFSRVDRKGHSFEPTAVEQVLKTALANLQVAVTESQARIICDPMPVVRADAGQLVQVFQNLVGNAIKFRSERPLEIHIGVQKIEKGWQFAVQDNGIGIEAQYFDRVFLLFQRLHTRSKYPGTGIGLALCKKIIERHGGKIWIESTLNQGTTFFLTLPER